VHAWLLLHALTAIITAKAGGEVTTPQDQQHEQPVYAVYGGLRDRAQPPRGKRDLRVQKYRGCFDENEPPISSARTVLSYGRTPDDRNPAAGQQRGSSSGTRNVSTRCSAVATTAVPLC
jgi:hypothetical protein